MQSLKKRVAEFKKAAGEAHQLNQRMTGLYEDMGHILNRYYDITEDKGDMDNDGIQEPDDEEYLDNKDKAIKNAMGETVNDPDGLAPDSPAQTGDEMEESLDADKTAAKDGRNFQNKYAAKDGEDMKESSQSSPHNVDGNNPNGGEDPAGDGEELKELKRSLRDVGGVVGIPSLGQIARKFSK